MVVSAVPASGDNDPGPATGLDPLGDPFLRTRFAVPERPATFLRRTRLTRHLDQGLRTPLTLVDGCAGAGKTLLVADWAAHLRLPVAWLTDEAPDQAPGVFWSYLLESLRACGVREIRGVGCPADAGSVDHRLLVRLAARLSGRDRPLVVVLDEYDRVTAPEIAEQLGFVLHHAGPGLHLVLVTRTEPMLPLHRYRAEGSLTEIRDAELAFTPDEAATLLESHGLRLADADARALVERTRGWAAGLRLAALAARQSGHPETCLREFEAGQSAIADFLLAEVLRRQPEETQDLLLRVSVLDRFCPDLADALTGRRDAGPLLAGLDRANAFVEHLGHSWYRLHPLFAEILGAHLRARSPGLETELHRRAAGWLRHHGPLSETLAHGAAAGDWEFTARALVDDLAIGRFFTGPRSDGLDELFSRMTSEASGPEAELVRAARELTGRDPGRAGAHLEHARRELDRIGWEPVGRERAARGGSAPDPVTGRLSCALLDVLVARLAGAPGRAEHAAETARRLRREVPSGLLDRHPELEDLLQTQLGSVRLWAGRFADARTALYAAAAGGAGASTALPRAESLSLLALIDWLDGWPARAKGEALAALAEAERFSLSGATGSELARLVLAAVAVERDELDQARTLLARTGTERTGPPDPVTAAGRVIVRGNLQLALGQVRAALETAESVVPAVVASPWLEDHLALLASAAHLAEGRPETAAKVVADAVCRRAACAAAAARAQLAAGNVAEAVELLDGLTAGEQDGPAVTVRVMLARAQAADRTGDHAAARRLAHRAVSEARRERLRRPFAEAGPWVQRVLDTDAAHRMDLDWLAPRPGARRRSDPGAAAPPVVEALSGRERDVLRRLARAMSTEEIAADLFVSVNTVKTHLKSAYRKLGVNRRNDAVRRARELRLL
ncbi:LuxR C-terminal-related transcriptional regulator [Streptomyces sp. NPDC015220]|uniref:LuxR C-terminal-related transcriptional regulator n=1 Tax=Streptomyces sp. NPDC015220 TaxID=3364947 RepID=UPI0036F5F32C